MAWVITSKDACQGSPIVGNAAYQTPYGEVEGSLRVVTFELASDSATFGVASTSGLYLPGVVKYITGLTGTEDWVRDAALSKYGADVIRFTGFAATATKRTIRIYLEG